MKFPTEFWNWLVAFSGSSYILALILALIFLVFLINFLFPPDSAPSGTPDRSGLMRFLLSPVTFYARNLALRRFTINLLGVLLIVWFAQFFSGWIQPALKPDDLFPPPFTGPQAIALDIVDKGPVIKYATYTGTVQPIKFIEINARVDGYIEKLLAFEGDRVKAGSILAKLDTTDLKPRLMRMIAEARFWGEEWRRAKSLFEDSVISASERDRIRKSYEVAKARVLHTRNQVRYATIRSPISGRVSVRKAYKGQYILKGERIFRIDRLDTLRLLFLVSERDLPFIKPGNKVWLEFPQIPMLAFNRKGWKRRIRPSSEDYIMAALNGQKQRRVSKKANPLGTPGMLAKVAVVFPALDPKTQLGTVESRISNFGGLLKSDSYVVGRFMVERVRNTVRVPSSAVIQLPGGQAIVFIGPAFSDEGNAELRKVEIGLRTDSYTQVLSGVKPKEFVVVRGQRGLTDEQLVTVVARKGGS